MKKISSVHPPTRYAATRQATRKVTTELPLSLFRTNAMRSGTLPPHYREVRRWEITQSRWPVIVVNLLSLPLAALMVLVFFGWMGMQIFMAGA